VDPLAEDYYDSSPYNYSLNNPILYLDPNGEGVWDVIKGIGKGIVNFAKNTVEGIASLYPSPQNQIQTAYGTAVLVGDIRVEGIETVVNDKVESVKEEVIDKIETIQNDETGEATAEIITEAVLDVGVAVLGTKGLGAASNGTKITKTVGAAQKGFTKKQIRTTKPGSNKKHFVQHSSKKSAQQASGQPQKANPELHTNKTRRGQREHYHDIKDENVHHTWGKARNKKRN
jgi:hypothetical protein